MFCPKCGKENDDSAQFCSGCGNKLNASSEANQAPAVSATAAGGVTTGDGSTAATAHKIGRILVIIGVIVVLVAAIAVFATGGFGLMGPSVKDSTNDYSWEELSRISAEISKASDEVSAVETAKGYNLTTPDGKLDGTQTKDLQLSDGSSAQVQIAGFWHDDKTDGGKAGITFIFKDAIARHGMNSSDTNSGGWEGSQMRSWLSSDVLNMLPEDLRNRLITVNKLTNNTGETESVSSVTSTPDKLWLYSYAELAGNVNESDFNSGHEYLASIYNAEGSQYRLFSDRAVNKIRSNSVLVKQFDSKTCDWWERSPYPGGSDDFDDVYVDGRLSYGYGAGTTYGVVPGFCI